MLSGESTPLLKESIELREGTDRLDMNGADRNNVLFSGTKALQVEKAGEGGMTSRSECFPDITPKLKTFLFSSRWWLSRRRSPYRFRHHPGSTRSNHDLLHRARLCQHL